MINGNYKVTLKAKQKVWMKPSADANEFVLDDSITKVAMIEIAKTNKIKIDSGLSKPDFYDFLINSIHNMTGVDIMSEQPITQQVDKFVQDGFTAKKGKWIIIAAMSEIEGINQAKLESMYKETSIRLGLEVDPKAVKASISEYFDSQPVDKITDWASVEVLVKGAVEAVKNADEKMALTVLKKSAKSEFEGTKDWKFPKKAGGKKGGGGSTGGLFKAIPTWVAANKKATGDQVMTFLSAQTKSEQRITNMYILVSGIMKSYNTKFVEATPVEAPAKEAGEKVSGEEASEEKSAD